MLNSSSASYAWEPEVQRLVSGATPTPLPSWVESFVTRGYYIGGCPIRHVHAANHNTSVFCTRCSISFCRNQDSIDEHKPHGLILVQRLGGAHAVTSTELAALCNIQGIRRSYRSGQDVVLVYPDLRWPSGVSRRLSSNPMVGFCVCTSELDESEVSRGFVYCSLLCKLESMKRLSYLQRSKLPELLAGLRYWAFENTPIVPWIDEIPWGRLHLGDVETEDFRRWMGSLVSSVERGIDPAHPPSTRVFCTGCDKLGCKSSKFGHDKLPLRKMGEHYGINVSLCQAVMNIEGIQRLPIQKEECVLVVGSGSEASVFPSSACVCGARLRNVDQGIVFCSIACKKACLDNPAIRRRAMLPDLYKLLLDECLSGEVDPKTGLRVRNGGAAEKRGLDFDLNMEPEVSRLAFLELPDTLTSALAVQECMDESTREKIAASDREAKRKRAPAAERAQQDPDWFRRQIQHTLKMIDKRDGEKLLQEPQMTVQVPDPEPAPPSIESSPRAESPRVSTPPRSENVVALPSTSTNTASGGSGASEASSSSGEEVSERIDCLPGNISERENLSENASESCMPSSLSVQSTHEELDCLRKQCAAETDPLIQLTIVAERMLREELERIKAKSSKELSEPPVVMRVAKKKRSVLPVSKRRVTRF